MVMLNKGGNERAREKLCRIWSLQEEFAWAVVSMSVTADPTLPCLVSHVMTIDTHVMAPMDKDFHLRPTYILEQLQLGMGRGDKTACGGGRNVRRCLRNTVMF